jgi:hypothetical protein
VVSQSDRIERERMTSVFFWAGRCILPVFPTFGRAMILLFAPSNEIRRIIANPFFPHYTRLSRSKK